MIKLYFIKYTYITYVDTYIIHTKMHILYNLYTSYLALRVKELGNNSIFRFLLTFQKNYDFVKNDNII